MVRLTVLYKVFFLDLSLMVSVISRASLADESISMKFSNLFLTGNEKLKDDS